MNKLKTCLLLFVLTASFVGVNAQTSKSTQYTFSISHDTLLQPAAYTILIDVDEYVKYIRKSRRHYDHLLYTSDSLYKKLGEQLKLIGVHMDRLMLAEVLQSANAYGPQFYHEGGLKLPLKRLRYKFITSSQDTMKLIWSQLHFEGLTNIEIHPFYPTEYLEKVKDGLEKKFLVVADRKGEQYAKDNKITVQQRSYVNISFYEKNLTVPSTYTPKMGAYDIHQGPKYYVFTIGLTYTME